MKDKKLEANLSLVVSRIFAGLNMNALKFLLPVWMGALTGVTVRCTFAAIAFWVTGWFVKEAPITRRQRIGLLCLGAFGMYGLCSAICWVSVRRHLSVVPYSIPCNLSGYFLSPFSFCPSGLH